MLCEALEVVASPSVLETQGPESGKAQGSPSGETVSSQEWESAHAQCKRPPLCKTACSEVCNHKHIVGRRGKGREISKALLRRAAGNGGGQNASKHCHSPPEAAVL